SQTKSQTGTMEFLPYGARHTATGTLPHHQFTAKPYDTGTGLYYFPYRHYSPAMARWTAPDPEGLADGPNVYGYVRGRSITHNDPMGEIMLRIPPTGPDSKDDCISGWNRCIDAGIPPFRCSLCLNKCTAQAKWPRWVPDWRGCDRWCGPGPKARSPRRTSK
ncbi:MAG: RHS repeat-associated core domain-containing protein, partial [Candidatus Hydrogenedentes bacterium]|nr:RHS repeat-associated core domain-containing protein [Candidatus Hydrogenedentota bacterium]